MRLRTFLTLATLIPLALTAAAVTTVIYLDAHRRSCDMGRQLMASANSRAMQEAVSESKQSADLTRTLAGLAGRGLAVDDPDVLIVQLLAVLRANPGITWVSYSDASGTFNGAYRDANGRVCTNQSHIIDGKTSVMEYALADDGTKTLLRCDTDSGYDPRQRPFYVQAAAAQGVVWLPPYIFFGQGIPGISCAMAVRGADGSVRGVVSVDHDLNYLSQFAKKVAATSNSKVMIYTSERTLIAHSTVRVVPAFDSRGQGKLLTLNDVDDPVTRTFARTLAARGAPTLELGKSSFLTFKHEGESYLACIRPCPIEPLPAQQSTQAQYVTMVAPLADFAPSAWQFARLPIAITVAALLAAVLVAHLLARRINKPIEALVDVSEKIGGGNLNLAVELGSLREFKRLREALNKALADLRDWVRLRASLNLAMEIHRRVQPASPPYVPGFDIAGYCAYTEETGGNYYDFIVVDQTDSRRFIVALGDVMGHGLPSALLMAGARNILRNTFSSRMAPGALLTNINSLLFRDTQGKRSMTMCLLCFDTSRAGCNWASAGHEPPIIYDPVDRVFMELEGGDVALGMRDDTEYGNYHFGPLAKHMIVFIGSHGVWQSQSPQGEQFGKDRLKQVIAENAGDTAQDIKQAIINAIDDFRGPHAGKQDITFAIIKEGDILVKKPDPDASTPSAEDI